MGKGELLKWCPGINTPPPLPEKHHTLLVMLGSRAGQRMLSAAATAGSRRSGEVYGRAGTPHTPGEGLKRTVALFPGHGCVGAG
jgi:hypothetical protein